MSGTRLTFVNYRLMGDLSARFRERAIHCRMLAEAAHDAAARRELLEIAQELDDEADKVDAESVAKARRSATSRT
jgi:hypothetical protein